jgi:hypothetical protein
VAHEILSRAGGIARKSLHLKIFLMCRDATDYRTCNFGPGAAEITIGIVSAIVHGSERGEHLSRHAAFCEPFGRARFVRCAINPHVEKLCGILINWSRCGFLGPSEVLDAIR